MTPPHDSGIRDPRSAAQGDRRSAAPGHGAGSGRGGGHGWMMIACCIPMLVVAIALVATGVVGAGFLVAAVGCTVMMAMMMRGMRQ